jgi:uncharacterized protein (TIGR03066 family)
MNVLRFALLVCLLTGLTGCRPAMSWSNKAMIVGKWEVVSKNGTFKTGTFLVFTSDGKMTLTDGKTPTELHIPGTYKVDGDELHTTLIWGANMTADQTLTITNLTATEMSTDEAGKKTVFKKK